MCTERGMCALDLRPPRRRPCRDLDFRRRRWLRDRLRLLLDRRQRASVAPSLSSSSSSTDFISLLSRTSSCNVHGTKVYDTRNSAGDGKPTQAVTIKLLTFHTARACLFCSAVLHIDWTEIYLLCLILTQCNRIMWRVILYMLFRAAWLNSLLMANWHQ